MADPADGFAAFGGEHGESGSVGVDQGVERVDEAGGGGDAGWEEGEVGDSLGLLPGGAEVFGDGLRGDAAEVVAGGAGDGEDAVLGAGEQVGCPVIRDEIKAEMLNKKTEEMTAGKFIVRWTSVLSNRFDTTAFKKEHGEMYKMYTKQTTSRRFSIT